MVSVLQDWWLVYRCEGLQETWFGHWSWFLQNRKACQNNKNIHLYTYCARQMVSHEIQLQHYATWLKRHLTDGRYNGLPKEPRQFLHTSMDLTLVYLNSLLLTGGASPGMLGISLLCGFTICDETVWTSFINSHRKIMYVFLLSCLMLFIDYLTYF